MLCLDVTRESGGQPGDDREQRGAVGVPVDHRVEVATDELSIGMETKSAKRGLIPGLRGASVQPGTERHVVEGKP